MRIRVRSGSSEIEYHEETKPNEIACASIKAGYTSVKSNEVFVNTLKDMCMLVSNMETQQYIVTTNNQSKKI